MRPLVCEGIGANLEVDNFRECPFSGLAVKWRARAPGGPDSLALPTGIRVVEAAVHSLREEAQRVRYPKDHEFPLHQSNQ